jgi:hypothetical protein
MAMSEARKNANKRWNDANLKERYDRLQLVIPKGEKKKIQALARRRGESVNAFIWQLIQTELEKSGGGIFGISGLDDSDK